MEPMKRVVIVSAVFTMVAFLFLVLRCISRFLIVRKVGLDDVFAICGTVASVAFLGSMIKIMEYSGGRYFLELTSDNQTNFLKWLFVSVLQYAFAMTTTKGSALLQFLRFIQIGRMRIFCWAMVGFILGFGVISLFVNFFACRPLAAIWNLSISSKTCIEFGGWFWVWAWYIILTDIVLVAIPILTFRDMKLPHRQKVALMIVFALGSFASIVSFVRLHSVYQFATRGSDWSRHEPDLVMWSHIELNIGLVCIHTPSLKAIVNRMFPHILQERPIRDEVMDTQDSELSGITLTTTQCPNCRRFRQNQRSVSESLSGKLYLTN